MRCRFADGRRCDSHVHIHGSVLRLDHRRWGVLGQMIGNAPTSASSRLRVKRAADNYGRRERYQTNAMDEKTYTGATINPPNRLTTLPVATITQSTPAQ